MIETSGSLSADGMKLRKASAGPRVVIDLHGAFIRRTDLSGANLEDGNLSGADCTPAVFRGTNFRKTKLDGTILKGALTDARNLTREQLALAIIDDATILPDELRAASASS